MSIKLSPYLTLLFLFVMSCSSKQYEKKLLNNSKKTYILKTNEGFQLIRNNKPYKIKGAVAFENLNLIKEYGGNSIRTYTAENALNIFQQADSLGLTVHLGLWLPHLIQFDYSNKKEKEKLLLKIKRNVLRYRNEPSLLMWCIGNEFQLYETPNIDAWKFVNEISKMIHSLDPNHPTTIAIAGYPRKHLPFISYYCDDLDLLSINKFGELKTVQDKMKNPIWGYDGAYILSELGTTGYWSPYLKKHWNMTVEETDFEKTTCLKQLFTKYSKDNNILGSYVFYWGQKQEYTSTWLNLFGSNNERTQMLEEVKYQWSGSKFKNSPPQINTFEMQGSINTLEYLKPLTEYKINFSIQKKIEDSISITLKLLPESRMFKNIYDKEIQPKEIPFHYRILKNIIYFTTPKREGPMRLYIYVKDKNSNICSQNIILRIQ